MSSAPKWVSWWFRAAAVYGAVSLVPAYLVPPPNPAAALTYYGFVGTALAFQIVFWIIGGDPARFRPLMLAGVAEKLGFGVPVAILVAHGVAAPVTLLFGGIDLLLGAGFFLAWRATPASRGS